MFVSNGIEIDFECTPVFEKNWDALQNVRIRVIVNRGGTRSSKTYSLAQIFVILLFVGNGLVLSVVRKTFPALRATAMRDILDVLEKNNLMQYVHHNKGEHLLIHKNNCIEFFSLDDEQKVRGRKRTHLWVNEANEASWKEWQQLILRTTQKAFVDFNPDDEQVWINVEIEQKRAAIKNDVELIVSNYIDNTFLDKETIAEIEYMKNNDEKFWKAFGLGQYATITGLIFPNYKVKDMEVDGDGNPRPKFLGYGLDFGFSNDPAALIAIYRDGNDLYLDEEIYSRGLINADLINEFKKIGLRRSAIMVADSAEPKSIEEISRAGFNIFSARKGGDSVRASIRTLQGFRIFLTSRSVNLQREFRTYKFIEDKNGNSTGVPIDGNDHGIDAVRYFALNQLMNERKGKYVLGTDEDDPD
jgi:phage terminase large subunit